MKYLILIVLIAGGYYFTQIDRTSHIKSWSQVLDKVDAGGASIQDVKVGVDLIAQSICSDAAFQEEVGETVESCITSYLLVKKGCEANVFDDVTSKFSSRERVKKIAKAYTDCAGLY